MVFHTPIVQYLHNLYDVHTVNSVIREEVILFNLFCGYTIENSGGETSEYPKLRLNLLIISFQVLLNYILSFFSCRIVHYYTLKK